MDDIIKTFHVDWKLLIAQVVNFTIVLAVLWFFAIKPLIKLMSERSAKIEKGLENADNMDVKMREIEEKKEAEVKLGRVEAQNIIQKAEEEGENVRKEKVEKMHREADKIKLQALNQVRAERESMIKEVKTELSGLLALALNKITAKTVNAEMNDELIKETVSEVGKSEIKSR